MRDRQRSRHGEPDLIRPGLALLGVAMLALSLASPASGRELRAASGELLFAAPAAGAPGFQEELPGEAPNLDITFLFSAVGTFSPNESSTAWSYAGAGCRSVTGGTPYFDMDLQLPEDAILDYLRVYYYDADATNNVLAEVYELDLAGTATQLASASSTGSAGWGDAGSGFFFHRVSNLAGALMVRVSSGAPSATIYFCGIRVRYSPALIFADGFETGNTTLWSVAVP